MSNAKVIDRNVANSLAPYVPAVKSFISSSFSLILSLIAEAPKVLLTMGRFAREAMIDDKSRMDEDLSSPDDVLQPDGTKKKTCGCILYHYYKDVDKTYECYTIDIWLMKKMCHKHVEEQQEKEKLKEQEKKLREEEHRRAREEHRRETEEREAKIKLGEGPWTEAIAKMNQHWETEADSYRDVLSSCWTDTKRTGSPLEGNSIAEDWYSIQSVQESHRQDCKRYKYTDHLGCHKHTWHKDVC